MRLHAMPARKSVSEAAMLLAVAVAFLYTINLLGTYTRRRRRVLRRVRTASLRICLGSWWSSCCPPL